MRFMNIKSRRKSLFFLVIFLFLPLIFLSPAEGENFSSEIVRLHVIANSDNEKDQFLKLRVRDAVLKAASNLSLKENAAKEIESNISILNDAAKIALASYGSTFSVKTQFGRFDFPVKSYGNITLPQGEYTAVRVIIGEGIGKNWWCVMYPPLCFTSETCAEFDDETVDLITNGLHNSRPQFKIKFKFLELFE